MAFKTFFISVFLLVVIFFVSHLSSCNYVKSACHTTFEKGIKQAAVPFAIKYGCDLKLVLDDLDKTQSTVCGEKRADGSIECSLISKIIISQVGTSISTRWKCDKKLFESDIKKLASAICAFI